MGDSSYTGVHKREENLGLTVDWQVAMKPGQRRKLAPGSPAALGGGRPRHRYGPRWNTPFWM